MTISILLHACSCSGAVCQQMLAAGNRRVLRCVQAEQWRRDLQRSQQAMRLLAGDTVEEEDLPDSASTPGASQQQAEQEGPSSQVKLSVSVQLGEVALSVSGRTAEVWWPAEVCNIQACCRHVMPMHLWLVPACCTQL